MAVAAVVVYLFLGAASHVTGGNASDHRRI
jgi:hypothetical protein